MTIVGPATPVEPFRLETIVVGLDGSTHAARALSFVSELAPRVGAEVVVANAIPADSGEHRRIGEPRRPVDARRELVDGWCEPLRDAGIAHRIVVAEGDARTVLLELARDRHADLLVVGSRGLGPVARLLLGSVASSHAQHGELPVTIVPHGR